jgi:hypothetical protein
MFDPFRKTALTFAVTLGRSLVGSALEAKDTLNTVATFRSANIQLDVHTFTDAEAKPPDDKVGLLTITNPPLKISFAFDRKQVDAIIALWVKTAKTQSPTWKTIGSMKETGTSDISEIAFSAGPGTIRLVISSPARGAVTYNIPSTDAPRLEQALNQVKAFMRQ